MNRYTRDFSKGSKKKRLNEAESSGADSQACRPALEPMGIRSEIASIGLVGVELLPGFDTASDYSKDGKDLDRISTDSR